MAEAPLTQSRDRRVEELELRLRSMEETIKTRVSNDVDLGDNSRRPHAHSSSNQSEFGTSDSSSSDPASTMASGKIRAWSGPSSEGTTSSFCVVPNLIAARIFEYTRQKPNGKLARSTQLR